jgi:hypothetical protein
VAMISGDGVSAVQKLVGAACDGRVLCGDQSAPKSVDESPGKVINRFPAKRASGTRSVRERARRMRIRGWLRLGKEILGTRSAREALRMKLRREVDAKTFREVTAEIDAAQNQLAREHKRLTSDRGRTCRQTTGARLPRC